MTAWYSASWAVRDRRPPRDSRPIIRPASVILRRGSYVHVEAGWRLEFPATQPIEPPPEPYRDNVYERDLRRRRGTSKSRMLLHQAESIP